MKFGYTILYVKDVPHSVAFYEDAFGLSRRFVHEEGMYAEMDTGETTLAFAAYGLARNNLPCGFHKNNPSDAPGGFEIALVTENVQAAYERALEAGARIQVAIVEHHSVGIDTPEDYARFVERQRGRTAL